MSHSFSLLYQGIHNQTRQQLAVLFGDLFVVLLTQFINQHNGRLFGDLFVVLFVDFIDVCSATYRRLFASLNDVFLRHLSASV
jgi:hypothetical protein